jgi:hypothetical protein
MIHIDKTSRVKLENINKLSTAAMKKVAEKKLSQKVLVLGSPDRVKPACILRVLGAICVFLAVLISAISRITSATGVRHASRAHQAKVARRRRFVLKV